MKIFKTYPFTGREEVQHESASFYYKVFSNENFDFEIEENILNGKIRAVTYRPPNGFNLASIQDYHRLHYSNLELFQVEESLAKNVYKITDFKAGEAFRFYIFHLNKAGEVQKQQWYDIDYNVLQYQEEVFVEGKHVETKIFYPASWNISVIKLD